MRCSSASTTTLCTKRVGLASGDEIGVATPLPALIDADETARWTKLAEVIKQRRITDLVLGYPYNMDGSAGFKAKEVDAFAVRLKTTQFGLMPGAPGGRDADELRRGIDHRRRNPAATCATRD